MATPSKGAGHGLILSQEWRAWGDDDRPVRNKQRVDAALLMLHGPFLLSLMLGGAEVNVPPAMPRPPGIITVEGVAEKEAAPEPPPSDLTVAEPVSDEIVVTAEDYGKARVGAETEFDEAAIGAHGADSIQQLLQKLAPWIDPGGDEPILLINGEPAGFDRSILAYPAEALSRLEVLKPEAASEYGQAAGKRVVNLVVKRRFSSLNADLAADWATAGGQSGQRLSVARTAISGRMRWNVQARISRDTALWKHERGGQRREGAFDGSGAIIGAGGGEIDPTFSDRLGRAADIAGLPKNRDAAFWTLDDFADLAGRGDPIDAARYETLMPARQSASLAMGLTRPLGGFNLSVNVQASQSDNVSRRGPAMAETLWQAGHAASPFSQDVWIVRPVDGLTALEARSKTQSFGASFSLNGRIAGWQSNFGLNMNRSWNNSLLESGVDVAGLQAAQDAALLSPLAVLGREWLLISRNAGRSDNLSLQVNAQRPLLTLPAGDISLTLGTSAAMGRSESSQWGREREPVRRAQKRRQGQAQASLTIPVNRDKEGLLPLPVNLSLDVSAGISQSSGGRAQRRWSAGANLEPWRWLQLRGGLDRADMAPAFDQLDGARDDQIQRIFDYARQEMVEVIWITGGNPDLKRGYQQSLTLSAMVRPFSDNALSLNIGYRQSESRNGITALPELTPAVEQAFPERIVRDGEGRLIRVDARSINMLRNSSSSLNSGITLRWPTGGQAAAAQAVWQFQASANHRMALSSESQIREGLPVIDLLGGDSGQSRHNASLQITASRAGLGSTLSASWSSAGRLRMLDGGLTGAAGGLRFKPPLAFNLSAYLEPERLWSSARQSRIWKGLRFSLDVQNVTNQYRRVLRQDGSIPPGFARDDVDPLGRTMRVQLRKKF